MSFSALAEHQRQLALLQRSLNLGRLGHAYLFTGGVMDDLETVANTLARTLNCQDPPRRGETGLPLDSCDVCSSCRRIARNLHPDVHQLRPESKLRQITIEPVRELIRVVHLKPHEAKFKVAIISGADRMNVQASNAFLKTLEEPPADSLLVLLSTEPMGLIETIRSRCLHLSFGESNRVTSDAGLLAWLGCFASAASQPQQHPLDRYRLLGFLLNELAARKKQIEKRLAAESPLEKYPDMETDLQSRYETELNAAIESEYRRQRGEALCALLWWLRDVWLLKLGSRNPTLGLPNLRKQSIAVAERISEPQALNNLKLIEKTQLLLARTNVQETLALETTLLKLSL